MGLVAVVSISCDCTACLVGISGAICHPCYVDVHSSRPRSRRKAGPREEAHEGPVIYGWRHTFSSLANYDFLCLWLSMVLLWGGFYMQPVARGLLVYDITESSTILGLVSAGGNLPLAAVALFGGAIADRMDRKSLIQIGHGAIAVTRLVGAVSITMA